MPDLSGSRLGGCLFAATTLVSAALMFAVEPMVGKALLPAFGGGATVWTSVMLFFQVALLVGYALAHWSTSAFGPRRTAVMQAALAAIGALALPVVPHVTGTSLGPTLAVIATLCMGYGMAVVAMAGNAPVLQHWFGLSTGREPYRLYAVSNAGSLLGLALYPLYLERALSLPEQGALWRVGFVACMAAVAACALVSLRRLPPHVTPASIPATRPGWKQAATWVCLAALPSSLLLGVTQHLTVNVAPLPFLWTLPLALYLVTFIAAFSAPAASASRGARFQLVTVPLLVVMAAHPGVELDAPGVDILLHLMAFGGAALFCHGRLAGMRPDASGLTGFYLCVSLGGALGGVFNALVAPLLFDRLIEYPLVLSAALLLSRPAVGKGGTATGRARPWLQYVPAALLATMLFLMSSDGGGTILSSRWVSVTAGAVLGALSLTTSRRGIALLLAVGMIGPLYLLPVAGSRIVHSSRDFYGPIRVEERDGKRILVHGTTIHGMQWLDPARSRAPLVYYRAESGIGHLFATLKARREAAGAEPLQVSAVGLGSGTLACYGDAGTRITFIEIDPGMVDVASRVFTFLRDCPGRPVEVGDGRLLIEAKPPGSLDLVIMDAFSGDNVPAHLLTAEAVRDYMSRLRPGGAVAFHITNRYLNLEPIVVSSAVSSGARAYRYDVPSEVGENESGLSASAWMAVTSDPDLEDRLVSDGWKAVRHVPGDPAWTDDRWDLMSVLKR